MKKNSADKTQMLIMKKTIYYHFLYIIAYSLTLIIFDSWNLVQDDPIKQRWTAVAALLVTTAFVWYLISNRKESVLLLRLSLFALIAADLALAATTVYTERGMASPAVMLFSIPIVASAAALNKSTVFLAASLATATYSMTIIQYFVNKGSEGFKVQLYGTLFIYVAVFFLLASFLASLIQAKK